ncbi:Signal transduction response regulator / Disease resistance domain-containing protein / Tetratricopeptide repeat-containing protein [Alloactinosynnema sp. L-07]|nr:Signal transduction response regulator / Disease resistance domain-containing protein / Tetratricopeptide repeat-containing protein [Alloactinosynnema sp. L-07]
MVGERSQTLLAELVRHSRDGVSDERLVAELWPDALPSHPTKALQVVVSRTRAATDTHVITRSSNGYRLGIAPDQVDALKLAIAVQQARARLAAGDAPGARSAAEEAVELGRTIAVSTDEGALGDLLAAALAQADEARDLLGLALSRVGEHERALPMLAAAVVKRPADEDLLACLLRSESAVHGPSAALRHFEDYRARLADTLGTDPGESLRRLHSELLAKDRPVRQGLLFDHTELVGRDADIAAMRALVRSARVTSIVGAGGLGKTRLAHVLGREADQPVVHFVELVGVVAAEDVVGEVGSALGVRDSLAGRRALTPVQRADVRARIAQQLDQSPALLILDNCEHVVDAVADLVAFLVSADRDLRVVTTTRAPLNISAERVYPLGQLGTGDAVELFGRRAQAARPDVALDEAVVADIVTRLDGLPLAIELAAARVRAMSVEDIARRLEDRFALLRGGDRTAPDRHQTLLAVIDWSWNLLAERERRGLRWLSVFHDGFTLAAAEQLIGPAAIDAVESLVDQSLLSVFESAGRVRYRMLETVREFGRDRLADAGETEQARSAHWSWACRFARSAGDSLFTPAQFELMDEVLLEETNLADVLRQALAASDVDTVIVVFAALGPFWMVRGEHPRVIVLAEALDQAILGWTPTEDIADHARTCMAVLISNAAALQGADSAAATALLRELGPGTASPVIAAHVSVVLSLDHADPDGSTAELAALCDHPDRRTACLALQWYAHALENQGDPEGALEHATRALALARDEEGPWHRAMLHTQVADLYGQLGLLEDARPHAIAALPVLDRLRAFDDACQLRALLAVVAMSAGRLTEAQDWIEQIDAADGSHGGFGGDLVRTVAEAEMALVRGDHAEGLRAYRDVVAQMRELRFPGFGEPTGFEPWTLFGEAAALGAHAQFGKGTEGAELYTVLSAKVEGVLDPTRPNLDHPVIGIVLVGLAVWGLQRDTLPASEAARLLALADRFGYNRAYPTMAWQAVTAPAEAKAAGEVARWLAEYGDRRGPQLLDEARAVVDSLFG